MKQLNACRNGWIASALIVLAGAVSPLAVATESAAETIMKERCAACHAPEDSEKGWIRISEQRKSPEGWAMTLDRMQTHRGAYLTSDEKHALIKYLADAQGLAPEESAPFRYVLERAPNIVEPHDEVMTEMCARCHSGARPALQRRTEEEWQRLVHFHVGQFPTIELHAFARDRPWFDIALESVVPHLAKTQPLETAAWENWKSQPRRDFSGTWRVAGHLPVDGEYDGQMTISRTGDDRYEVMLHAAHSNGKVVEGRGAGVVYTGYEWRAELIVAGVPVRQVLAASPDGRQLSGRMFQAQHDEIGGEISAVRNDAGTNVLAVSPSFLKAGEATEVTIVGTGLEGPVSLGGGVTVEALSQSSDRIVVRATADAEADLGVRRVQVGPVMSDQSFAVYDRIARVEVEPSRSIARVGENGTSQAKVRSTYRALAFAAGPDGVPGTEDDIRLGYMPATWSVKPFDEIAEHDKDVEFAGTMDGATGVFTPGDAGPNPQRLMSANNVGNLSVVATVRDGGEQVDGEGHLLVTIQNYMNPRIR